MELKEHISGNCISVFGLGKLGAVVAGCYASRGFRVVGVDVNPESVEKCKAGIPPVQEPGIEDLYRSCSDRLTATMNGEEALLGTDVTLVAVPTPSGPDGGYTLDYVLNACNVIGRALREKRSYHLVVLKSTVLPGAGVDVVIPRLEECSEKKCGSDFGFCYNPEFIALGNVISNIFNPDLTLIGESDRFAGDILLAVYDRLLTTRPPIARMNLANAELTKLAVNSYVTMKISFANLLASLCERIPGGDVDTVTAALGLDSRIGPKYLKGGLGFGGPCFPRDNAAMLSLARRLEVSFPLAEATDRANQQVPTLVANFIAAKAPPKGRIGILGLSYKPDTAVIDESQAIMIAKLLVERDFEIIVYDPLAMRVAQAMLGDGVRFAESSQACIDSTDVVVIATPWKQFKNLDYSPRNPSHKPLVVDCWGLLDDLPSKPPTIIRWGARTTRQA